MIDSNLPGPLALIAELTHRCPLHCVYCSNPLEMQKASSELPTEDWARIFEQAAKLGSLHVHLTGGEPLARADLTELVAKAHTLGLYTNLVTSGLGLNENRLKALVEAGLEHIQLSFQDSQEHGADEIAGTKSHRHKLELARLIRQFRIAFTMNVVVHRENLDRLPEIIALAEQLGPDRLEIAHVQYYGWALKNRDRLLPTREQVERCGPIIMEAQQRLAGKMRIDAVIPDYYAKYPKACMGGWGRRIMLIDPAGNAMPCHAAAVIPEMKFENVREHSLQKIWHNSSSFQKFRGESWMAEPCRSCERRTEDFGGCRCQAFLLAGDAAVTDPVCSLAPSRHVVDAKLAQLNAEVRSSQPISIQLKERDWSYRPNP